MRRFYLRLDRPQFVFIYKALEIFAVQLDVHKRQVQGSILRDCICGFGPTAPANVTKFIIPNFVLPVKIFPIKLHGGPYTAMNAKPPARKGYPHRVRPPVGGRQTAGRPFFCAEAQGKTAAPHFHAARRQIIPLYRAAQMIY